MKKSQPYEIVGHVQKFAAQIPLVQVKYSEYNILGQPIAFESQIQPTEFAGPEIFRQHLYVAVIPLVFTKIVLE